MSHIHIPDGVLPLPLWIGSYIVMGILLISVLHKMKVRRWERKVPYIAIMSAVMLIVMSIPLGIVPLHMSLAVFSGIFLGPTIGFVAIFVVNVILAFMGHGGITIIGLNTLVMGLEVTLGYFFFQYVWTKKIATFWRGFLTTFFTLIISTTLVTGFLIYTAGWEFVIPHSHHEHNIDIDHEEQDIYEHVEDTHPQLESKEALSEVNYLFASGGTALVLILMIGILLESFVTGGLLAFMMEIRPHLFEKKL